MATANPFVLLGDDAEDPSQLIAAEQLKAAAAPKKEQGKVGPRAGAVAQQSKLAQLPSKPVPPTQAVREEKNETSFGGRGGDRGGGRGVEKCDFFEQASWSAAFIEAVFE
ncbi:uncharacterized protein HKW66_Vig0194360 [Vigna angularis]|uniref:STM1-like N-terminal domain-containing protein n=1 Tax=Phaseolus angularis TaxID=3914 RepID=A0A8T0KR06_PHAAN|nr:uncharacterized protein HKW66_Vig0194360 [Vigna angularis]